MSKVLHLKNTKKNNTKKINLKDSMFHYIIVESEFETKLEIKCNME